MPNSNVQAPKPGRLSVYSRLTQAIILSSMIVSMTLTGCGLKGELTLAPQTPSQPSQNSPTTADDEDS